MHSVTSRSSSASAALRQRGYVRPQGSTFAPSAGNRDSVLSLGSIAHLQYYFARTGLLDGKGARTAQDERGKPGAGKLSQDPHVKIYEPPESNGPYENGPDSVSETGLSDQDADEHFMLPPTVSTYNHRAQYIAPPPDFKSLRSELSVALQDAKKALQEVSEQLKETQRTRKPDEDESLNDTSNHSGSISAFSQSSGWYEIQGMHILDVVTLAIRAAKIYYTSHDEPLRLYNIKSERKIREELLNVLDVLKRMAGRNFAGGMRPEELKIISGWVDGIESFISQEQDIETKEAQERAEWKWLQGDWNGLEMKREVLFLNTFNPVDPLPRWTPIDAMEPKATPFLDALRNGLTLVHLHNALLKKSQRQFGEIKTFHTDTAKPYRCAENLRYWIKAAEIRWETKLTVNVSGVVNGKSEAWVDFDAAIRQWSRAVREELTKEWQGSPTTNGWTRANTEHTSSTQPD